MAGRRLFNFVNCIEYVLYTHVTKINYSTTTTVEGANIYALIDTGASVTMRGRPLYQKVQQDCALKLQTHDMTRLEGVGGNPVPTLGCAEAEVGIAAGVYKTPVVVSARKERPNFIIGADFLSAHDCDLSLRQKLFTVGRDSVWCLP